MGDFEHRAADISVDHPEVVAHYRAAQAIAVRDKRGEADTEELRKAVVHYRALFDELLEVKDTKQELLAA
jgi:pyridoxal biosynthesis lyase PdxS